MYDIFQTMLILLEEEHAESCYDDHQQQQQSQICVSESFSKLGTVPFLKRKNIRKWNIH